MPSPEGVQWNPSSYSGLLTQYAISYLADIHTEGFIAGQVFKTIPVAAPSGSYNVWNRGDFLRRGGKRLANYEAAPIEGFGITSRTYSVDNWGVATLTTARDLAEARAGGTTDAEVWNLKTELVTARGVIEKEIAVAALVQTAGNWATTRAGVASGPTLTTQYIAWDQAAAVPVDDVLRWIEDMRLASGKKPNTLIIPIQLINVLKKNASLIDRIKYGGTMAAPTEVTTQQIQGLFGLENFLIPSCVYNTAAEGQTQSFAYIWGTNMWLGYVAPKPGILTPSAGYNFAWTGNTANGLPVGMQSGDGPQTWGTSPVESIEGLFIRRYRENRPSGEFIESELWTTPNVTASDYGMTLTATMT